MKPTNPPIMLPIHTVIFACFGGLYNIYDVQYADGQGSRSDPDEFLISILILNLHIVQEHIIKKDPHNLLKR